MRIIKEHVFEMDVMRAISIIAVILIHITATVLYRCDIGSHTYIGTLVLNQLSRFSVPIFILISGIGLSLSYKKDKSYFSFIKRRFNKILPKYIIWCVIYTYFISRSIDIHGLISNIFYGKVFYHFYYIPIIVEFYLIFPFIERYVGNKWFVFLSFIITTGIIIYTRYFTLSEQMQWFLDKKNLLDWIFYFSLGSFIAKNINSFSRIMKKYKYIVIGLFTASVFLLIQDSLRSMNMGKDIDYITTFMRPSVLIYTVMLAAFIFSINWKDSVIMKGIGIVSANSYDIYLSHALILFYYTERCLNHGILVNNLAFEIKAFVVTFFGALLINKVKKFI